MIRSRTIPLLFSVYINDQEYEIAGDYTPAVSGNTSGPVEACYPDEPSDFEITSIKVEGAELTGAGEELLSLITSASEEAAEKAYELLCEENEAAYEDHDYGQY